MKTIRLALFTFGACLALGTACVLLSPPQTQASDCNFGCTPIQVCSGPVGSCTSPFLPIDHCYPPALEICDPEFSDYICCVQIGCGLPC